MFFRKHLFLVLLAFVVACKAENAEDKSIEVKKPSVDNSAFIDYVPAGWILQKDRILDIDIDRDGNKDAILTLIEDEHLKKGDLPDIDEERALLVLLGDKNGKYRRSSFAKNAILCASCAGMMGSGNNKEPGEIRYADNVFTIGWISGSRDTVDVELTFGFNAQLKQFVLVSDSMEKRDRLAGESRVTKRDFVAGTKTVDSKTSKIEKKVLPLEKLKFYNYLKYDFTQPPPDLQP